uniref:Uncharacterized protein n=1 Tax=Knipowitschia caucasica TaxID=637954 RepID=A0AAV2MBW7_KNICA
MLSPPAVPQNWETASVRAWVVGGNWGGIGGDGGIGGELGGTGGGGRGFGSQGAGGRGWVFFPVLFY